MNWLAHLVLSEPSAGFRVGNLLPDLVSARLLTSLPQEVLSGVERHRHIDAFTDAHPVFVRSARRFAPPLRRFGKVLSDVIYDHFLAKNWSEFSTIPLSEFLSTFYASFETTKMGLPDEARLRLDQIRRYNWINTYGDIEGIQNVLYRMGRRLKRPIDLVPAVSVLKRDYHEFQTDFYEFFPEIQRAVAPNLKFPLIG